MGLLSFAFTGFGFILIGAHEALSHPNPRSIALPSSRPSSLHSPTPSSSKQDSHTNKNPSSPSLFFIFVSIFSFFFILNSLISLLDAHNSRDGIGAALQLQDLAIALIFLFCSLLGFLTSFKGSSFRFPSSLLLLICVFAFAEEFLLFYLQRKDPIGIENRYYDLLLVPIAICVFSTIFELKWPKSNTPKLGRGVGLILQGTWFVQMGLSVFSNWIAQGCSLHQVSRGNFTVRCKGHDEYHRARAIATLQFNCHLALMVVVIVGLYSVISRSNGGFVDSTKYRPLGAELQSFENSTHFTLDSDDDADGDIKEDNVAGDKANIVESGMNGLGSQSHH